MEQESDITELPARSDLRLDNPTDLITDDEEIRQGNGNHDFGRFRTVSTRARAREAEWELGTLATDNIVRHSRRAEITTLHEVLWMRSRVPPTPPR